jgi:hypothetical protein
MSTCAWPAFSYWQRGCDDARAGRLPQLPARPTGHPHGDPENVGYMNGYRYGKENPPAPSTVRKIIFTTFPEE